MPSETIELRGHIIDSLILPKVLDEIIARNASFKIGEIRIGENRVDQSFARIEVTTPSVESLDELILHLRQHGAEVGEKKSVQLAAAAADGVFPDGFYVTTNQQTFIRLGDDEIEVRPSLMNSAIAVDRAAKKATPTKFYDVKKGTEIVVGHQGIRVVPLQRSTARTDFFEFMSSNVSIEKPKIAVIREMAREFKRVREANGKILFVGGPAIVHTGAAGYVEKLIEAGYINLLFAGNALAARDIESALFGTSLGVNPKKDVLADEGGQNHLHAINAMRRA